MKPTPTIKSIEKEFPFVNHGEFVYNKGGYPATCGEIKSFYRQQIIELLEGLGKIEAKNTRGYLDSGDDWINAYWEGRKDAIFELNENIEKLKGKQQ